MAKYKYPTKDLCIDLIQNLTSRLSNIIEDNNMSSNDRDPHERLIADCKLIGTVFETLDILHDEMDNAKNRCYSHA